MTYTLVLQSNGSFHPNERNGLNSSILSPFCDAVPEFDCQGHEFPPVVEITCDPYSLAYTDGIFHGLDLDGLDYSTVDDMKRIL